MMAGVCAGSIPYAMLVARISAQFMSDSNMLRCVRRTLNLASKGIVGSLSQLVVCWLVFLQSIA